MSLIADGRSQSDHLRESLMKEYERTVIRCQDGRPAVSFHTWCFNKGIM